MMRLQRELPPTHCAHLMAPTVDAFKSPRAARCSIHSARAASVLVLLFLFPYPLGASWIAKIVPAASTPRFPPCSLREHRDVFRVGTDSPRATIAAERPALAYSAKAAVIDCPRHHDSRSQLHRAVPHWVEMSNLAYRPGPTTRSMIVTHSTRNARAFWLQKVVACRRY